MVTLEKFIRVGGTLTLSELLQLDICPPRAASLQRAPAWPYPRRRRCGRSWPSLAPGPLS